VTLFCNLKENKAFSRLMSFGQLNRLSNAQSATNWRSHKKWPTKNVRLKNNWTNNVLWKMAYDPYIAYILIYCKEIYKLWKEPISMWYSFVHIFFFADFFFRFSSKLFLSIQTFLLRALSRNFTTLLTILTQCGHTIIYLSWIDKKVIKTLGISSW